MTTRTELLRRLAAAERRAGIAEAVAHEAALHLEWEWYGHEGGLADPGLAHAGIPHEVWRERLLAACGLA